MLYHNRVRNDLDGLPHVPKGYIRVPLTAAAASQRDASPYKFERIQVRICLQRCFAMKIDAARALIMSVVSYEQPHSSWKSAVS
jgi:hypothetical protein